MSSLISVVKCILRNEYSNLEEGQDRLNMLSFSERLCLYGK